LATLRESFVFFVETLSAMTYDAFLPQGLVNHDGQLFLRLKSEVAFLACDFFMRTVELESAVAIMHEEQAGPHRGLVAFLAAHLIFLSELPAMHIFMAIDAPKHEWTKSRECFCRGAGQHLHLAFRSPIFRR
jgi:hypothetical protein